MTATDFGRRVRYIRLASGLSQVEFAAQIRKAGEELEDTNQCSKRLVQKWETGEHSGCRPNYKRALQHVSGLSFEQLCAPWVEPEAAAQPIESSSGLADAVATIEIIEAVMVRLAEAKARLMASAAVSWPQAAAPDPTSTQ